MMTEQQPAADSFLSQRQRELLRRAGAAALFALLIFFWWAVVYTFLLAGWWLVNGYDLTHENEFGSLSWVDWALMLLALATVWPVQRWLRTRIAHFMDAMDDPYAVVSRLSQQIDAVHATGSPMSTVARLLSETLNVPYVRIEADRDDLTAAYGAPGATPPITLSLRYNGAALGMLHIGRRVIAGAPVHVDERLLGDLARQVSVTLYAAQVSAELQESRRRIVTAREEGRRQLRRDLHDGLGPSLAAMTMQADTARELMADDPAAADRLLAKLVDQAQATVTEVRRIVHGLRPPALDDMGLYGALEVLANGFAAPGLQITLHLPAVRPTLSAATEVALYRIAQEALTNVSRHAQARAATVSLCSEDGQLVFTICDDGVGMPGETGAGLGLFSMRERAEELGGTLWIRPNSPSGCCVVARFPLQTGESHGRDPHPDLR